MRTRTPGYKGRDPISHRKYSFQTAITRYKRTGKLVYRGKGALKGSGHRAGEAWGDEKKIDPQSPETKYSKNSPSFDEGVYLSKAKRKALDTMKQANI
jgi:hypothetical protein